MLDPVAIEQLIRRALPDAAVTVREFAEGGDHFRVEVVSAAFAGKPRVAQHQLVYAALRTQLDSGTIHALSLVTRPPA